MGLRPTHGNEKHNRHAFIGSKQVTECFSTERPIIGPEPINGHKRFFATQYTMPLKMHILGHGVVVFGPEGRPYESRLFTAEPHFAACVFVFDGLAAINAGTLGMAYSPKSVTIAVAMSKFSVPVTARWYDPTNGTFQDITGMPFSNTGSRRFTTPGKNSADCDDWVLVLETHSDNRTPELPR